MNPKLRGLRPRTTQVDAAVAEAALERDRSFVLALTAVAITRGWDEGLISNAPTAYPHESRVLAALGYHAGFAEEPYQRARQLLATVAAASSAYERAHDEEYTPLQNLVDEFGLPPLARMVMMLIAAPFLWSDVARLYAVLAASDNAEGLVDEQLLTTLVAEYCKGHDVARELDAGAPLLRAGLVTFLRPKARPFSPLQPHPLLLARLRGYDLTTDPDSRLPVLPATAIGALHVPAALSQALWDAAAVEGPARLVLRGRHGSGRKSLLAALASDAGRRLAIIDMAMFATGEPQGESLAEELRRCFIAGWLPCVINLDGDQRGVRRVLDAHPGPLAVCVGHEDAVPLSPGHQLVDVPVLSESERRTVFAQALTPHGVAAEAAELLAARWRVGPGTIHRVARDVAARGPVTPEGIHGRIRQYVNGNLREVAELVTALPRLADVMLPADIMDSVTEFLARLRLARHVFDDWGMDKVATTARGLTALFQGLPGTGKTMLAGALAREMGFDLYRVDLSKVVSKWLGETERNLAKVFAAAEQSQAMILFDEADTLFAKRTEVKSSNDRHANMEVNYILQRLDTFVGVAILTTNMGTAIDAAFRRRLTFRIHFPIPDDEMREKIWLAHLPPMVPRDATVDLKALARKYPFAGGAVRNCALRAAFLAAAEGGTITQALLIRAIRLEYRAYGKLSESGPLE